MRARSLLVATLLIVAAVPATAQEYGWTADRPDGAGPLGMDGFRTLNAGDFEFTAMYEKMDHQFIRFDSQLFDPRVWLVEFTEVPWEMTSETYRVRIGLGLSDDLTFTAGVGFTTRDRFQVTDDTFSQLASEGLGDVHVDFLYDIYERGPIRAHVSLGGVVPTGEIEAQDEDGVRGGTLPYDMQIGAGGWGIRPGIAASMMNDRASVGARLTATKFVAERGDWRQGDRVDAEVYAAYNFNRFFGISSGARATGFGAIEGFDPSLNPDRDPGEFPLSYGGERVDIPVGVNFYMPDGRWMGHRLSIEFVYTVHEQLDGPWLARDYGFQVGWRKIF